MATRDSQNSSYINQVRALATALLDADDQSGGLQAMFNSFFGGASQLIDADPEGKPVVIGDFVGDNEGIVKADIENALAILTALKTFLDEAGLNRRVYLQKIRNL